ncbi:MAG: hypothetical protein K1X67_23235 [Fimbriimonadaceae bacterium]|nr:hypothetical protein [Fimbriimonadaceae bacterium]
MIDTAPRPAVRRRWRSATKIAIGFVLVVVGGFYGYRAWTNYMVGRIDVKPIGPKRVNLVAISPGAGYRILVANGIAQLAEVSGSFDAPDLAQMDEGSDVVSAKKVPMKEMLQSLRQETEGLGAFIMRINDIKADDIPPEAPVWKAEDLRKALDSDPALKSKLEREINMGLDGTPPNRVIASACVNGIVISTPVTVKIGGKPVQAEVLQPYRPSFIENIEKKLQERFDADDARPGVYRQALEDLLNGQGAKEDVRKSLLARISPERAADLAAKPQRVLENAAVILNDDQIISASARTYKANKRELTDITINLTDEGRDRLWKYSHDRQGFQLLLVVDGIAIAAPRISHELSQRDVTISQLPDASLAEEAVDLMNKKPTGGNAR